MKRDYDSGEFDNVTFFSGIEIENTPFKGQKTLFVVGAQTLSDILLYALRTGGIEHIYLGANHSFDAYSKDGIIALAKELIHNFNVTIDMNAFLYQTFLEEAPSELLTSHRLNVTVAFKLPHINKVKNLTIKIDDIDFEATNDCVWCFDIDDLPANTITEWDEYSKDEILK